MECCYKFLDKNEANDIQIVDVDKYIDIVADGDNLRFVDKIGIDLLKSDLLFLKDNLPCLDYFLRKDIYYSIHGISHIARTMFYSMVISKMLSFDYEVPVVAASLHDIGRVNDRKDEQHGLRSAEYYRNILSGQRKYDRYKKYTDIIYYVIANHNTCQSSGIFEYDMYLNILKTADALDRSRLQRVEWWPNGRLMPFKFLNHFMERFKIFTCRTEIDLANSDRSFDDVLNTIEVNLNVLIKDE